MSTYLGRARGWEWGVVVGLEGQIVADVVLVVEGVVRERLVLGWGYLRGGMDGGEKSEHFFLLQ